MSVPQLLGAGTNRTEDLPAVTMAAVTAGATTALRWWRRRAELTIRAKSDADDLVSEADLDTQAAIFAVLTRLRPGDLVHGEEEPAAGTSPGTAVEWWVDPIDGTTSFLYGRSDWSVSVAAVDGRDGQVLAAAVAEPVLGLVTTATQGGGTWSNGNRVQGSGCTQLARALVDVNLGRAEQRDAAGDMVGRLTPRVRDLRRGGSAAAALAQLATGRTDAVWAPGLQQWDGAAGLLLASEAGAAVGDLTGYTGARWPGSGDVLAAPPRLWDELRALLGPIYAPG
jgi:myo-inositol-1(or 4)-monophosphatase